jgi:hypothetical protein
VLVALLSHLTHAGTTSFLRRVPHVSRRTCPSPPWLPDSVILLAITALQSSLTVTPNPALSEG